MCEILFFLPFIIKEFTRTNLKPQTSAPQAQTQQWGERLSWTVRKGWRPPHSWECVRQLQLSNSGIPNLKSCEEICSKTSAEVVQWQKPDGYQLVCSWLLGFCCTNSYFSVMHYHILNWMFDCLISMLELYLSLRKCGSNSMTKKGKNKQLLFHKQTVNFYLYLFLIFQSKRTSSECLNCTDV